MGNCWLVCSTYWAFQHTAYVCSYSHVRVTLSTYTVQTSSLPSPPVSSLSLTLSSLFFSFSCPFSPFLRFPSLSLFRTLSPSPYLPCFAQPFPAIPIFSSPLPYFLLPFLTLFSFSSFYHTTLLSLPFCLPCCFFHLSPSFSLRYMLHILFPSQIPTISSITQHKQ